MAETDVFVFSKEKRGMPTDKCLARFSVEKPTLSYLSQGLDRELPIWRQQISEMAILIHDQSICAKVLRLLSSTVAGADKYQWTAQGLIDGSVHVYQVKPVDEPDMHLTTLPLHGETYMARLQLTHLCNDWELTTNDLMFLTELRALSECLGAMAKVQLVGK